MRDIIEIDKEETKLSELGLTYDLVMDGEVAEFDPEKKIQRKQQYVRHDAITAVIEAYAEDLRESYRANESKDAYIEELLQENEQMRSDLGNAKTAFEQTKRQLSDILASDEALQESERLLNTLETQMEKFTKAKLLDDETIARLEAEVEELRSREATIDDIRERVEDVLGNLASYFEEEGIEIDSEE